MQRIDYPTVLNIPGRIMSEDLRNALSERRSLHRKEDWSASLSCEYHLQAVVIHHGRKATGGHYSTYISSFVPAEREEHGSVVINGVSYAKVWRYVNDSKVSVVTEAQALAAQDAVRQLKNHDISKYFYLC